MGNTKLEPVVTQSEIIPSDQESTRSATTASISSHNSGMKEDGPVSSSVDKPEQQEHLTGVKLYTLLFALLLMVLMIALDAVIIATAIPRITDDFHTIKNVGWYGAAYLISNSCLQPFTGKVYKFFSLKTSFFGFVAVFEIGSVICAASTTSMMLVIGRAVTGMGSSGVSGGALTLISAAAPPEQRPTILGIAMSCFSLGQLLGPLIGGALTQHVSWRWCFWINLPIGVCAAAGLAILPLPRQPKPPVTLKNFFRVFDILGFIFFAPATIMLLLALQWGGVEYLWSSPKIIGLFCGSAAIYIVFILWEKRQGENAMFPGSLVGRPIVLFSTLTNFLLGGTIIAISYFVPLWFQVVKHASPTMSAVYTLPAFISQMLVSVSSGPLVTRLGFFTPPGMLGCAFCAIGAGLMTLWNPTSSTAAWIGFQILTGAGRGLACQQPINAVQACLPKPQLPIGMAIVIWAQYLGGGVFIAMAQTAFSADLKSALHHYAPEVNPFAVINAGATNYGKVVPQQALHAVLLAYNQAITRTYYLPAAISAAATLTAVGMGWKRVIGAKKQTQPSELESQQEQQQPQPQPQSEEQEKPASEQEESQPQPPQAPATTTCMKC